MHYHLSYPVIKVGTKTIIKQDAQMACIAHQSFNEKHTSNLISVTCKSQRET